MNIFRNPTGVELSPDKNNEVLNTIVDRSGRLVKNPNAKFQAELAKQQEIANKKGLPFASAAARADWKDNLDEQAKRSLRKNGYVNSNDIKIPDIDWSKYSDLNNFELIEEGETYDDQLSKRYSKPVYVARKTYRFKGFSNKYRIMEDAYSAVNRAKGLDNEPKKEKSTGKQSKTISKK